ncbi:MAG: response regulator transcription factor [Chloroflexi bacterium]|nr:response regulator transcription factor [Chloroflexota bacterium]
MIKLVVADDHILRRQGLVCLLRTCPDFIVIQEISVGSEILELPTNIDTDIFIVDANLPTNNKIDPTKIVHQWNPTQRVLILSDNESPLPAIRAFRIGASGYISRMEDFDHLSRAIHNVYIGRRYLSPSISEQVLNSVIQGNNYEDDEQNSISPREKEILQFLAEGKTNAEIGQILVISTRTVETHRNKLMKKLGLSSSYELLRYAVNHGLIRFD